MHKFTTKGYYLDNETNTYRNISSCHKHCSECYDHPINSTHMNCISCKKGYNLTEDTNSCYDYLPPQYYLDGNIFRRCHIRCYSCFNAPLKNDMNCLNCISSNYFYKKDTHACILPSEFDKREEEDLTIESSWAFIVFIIILFFSFLLAIIISSGSFFKRKDDIKDDENNKYKRVSDNNKKILGLENELGPILPS